MLTRSQASRTWSKAWRENYRPEEAEIDCTEKAAEGKLGYSFLDI